MLFYGKIYSVIIYFILVIIAHKYIKTILQCHSVEGLFVLKKYFHFIISRTNGLQINSHAIEHFPSIQIIPIMVFFLKKL